MTNTSYLQQLLTELDLKSTGFIITIYGDVVVPRGGTLWTGSLIEICDMIGLSESVVRTSLSRLVIAEQLQSLRLGRRSYYQLHPSAKSDFAQASSQLYECPPAYNGWQIIHAPNASDEDLRRWKATKLSAHVALRPDRGQLAPEGLLTFQASEPLNIDALIKIWELSDLDQRYQAMIAAFSPLQQAIQTGHAVAHSEAFVLRLLLVHVFRAALLRDPQLPPSVVGADWSGFQARRLFNAIYLALTPAAELYIGQRLEGTDGKLPAQTSQSDGLIQSLNQF